MRSNKLLGGFLVVLGALGLLMAGLSLFGANHNPSRGLSQLLTWHLGSDAGRYVDTAIGLLIAVLFGALGIVCLKTRTPASDPTDYSNQPVRALLCGPLLHTPQGLAVIAFSAVYILFAALFAFTALAPPPGWRSSGNAIALCLSWPFVLLLVFMSRSQTAFSASWGETAWIGTCALAPVLFTLWHM